MFKLFFTFFVMCLMAINAVTAAAVPSAKTQSRIDSHLEDILFSLKHTGSRAIRNRLDGMPVGDHVVGGSPRKVEVMGFSDVQLEELMVEERKFFTEHPDVDMTLSLKAVRSKENSYVEGSYRKAVKPSATKTGALQPRATSPPPGYRWGGSSATGTCDVPPATVGRMSRDAMNALAEEVVDDSDSIVPANTDEQGRDSEVFFNAQQAAEDLAQVTVRAYIREQMAEYSWEVMVANAVERANANYSAQWTASRGTTGYNRQQYDLLGNQNNYIGSVIITYTS